MKKIKIILVILVSAFSLNKAEAGISGNVTPSEGTISISGAFALYPMVVKWADEYQKLHPDIRIDISAGGAGKGMVDALSGMVDLGMVSREIYPQEIKKGAFYIAVTKDAVVPTISAKNPVLKDILAKGIKKTAFVNAFVTGTAKTWGQMAGVKNTSVLHVYSRSDACGAGETWAKYLGKKQEDLLGVGVFGDPGLATAVKEDPLAIGYNNIAYAYDSKTKKQNPGIRIAPIDINKNGKLDPEENFYGTIDEIVNAIATNKYPSPPARDLYLVSKGKPTNKAVIDFMKWILTDGQKFVHNAGYITLSNEKIQGELNKLK
ncbi:MAG: PstS family phosphate ABC transporter substrate-binding protein [Bacteroidales bacterium]